MRLCDLASVKSWLPTHPLASDPLWQREGASLSEGDIMLFYARAGIGRRQDAIEAIDTLQANVLQAVMTGELHEPPIAIVMHEPPPNPFFADELVDGLVRLRPARRRATLFALESDRTPEAISMLTWTNAGRMRQLSPLCGEVLQESARTRHLKLPYVFWEWATPEIATPLLELQWSIEKAFGCTWPQLAYRYRNMIKVNRSADSASLLQLANK